MAHAGHNPVLSDLRRRVLALEQSRRAARPPLEFGLEPIDRHLPWGGLPLGTLHECLESGVESEHAAAATLFTAGILARRRGTVLWCLRGRDLFAPALAAVGLGPDRVIYVETWKDGEVLPAMEEALRHGGLAGVVGEVARLGLTASRRLQLAAESSGVPAFVVRRWRSDSERAAADEPSVAFTRWRISAAPSGATSAPGLGRARWRVELLRCRGAEAASWIVEACDAEGRLALPALLPDRPHPQESRSPGDARPLGEARPLGAGGQLRRAAAG
ncbi:damage-inducible mutagenesis protein [Enterovirga sp.]|uniref:ImuA family protein n=1 Tax=Enterovirga sp. TaxID=2026350 RepID=UPI00261492F0|nr:damage-inducible mutagenesis protein [Enterovirga sp.]MDB5590710.1 damage-inducible mutasis protein [Enterovirga sp.]